MDIRPLCGRLGFEVCDFERRRRMWRTGFLLPGDFRPVHGSMSQIIEEQLVIPITAEIERSTLKRISYRKWYREGNFRLTTGGKPFALVEMPNPGTGRVFFRKLFPNGSPCSMSTPLYDTDQLCILLTETVP